MMIMMMIVMLTMMLTIKVLRRVPKHFSYILSTSHPLLPHEPHHTMQLMIKMVRTTLRWTSLTLQVVFPTLPFCLSTILWSRSPLLCQYYLRNTFTFLKDRIRNSESTNIKTTIVHLVHNICFAIAATPQFDCKYCKYGVYTGIRVCVVFRYNRLLLIVFGALEVLQVRCVLCTTSITFQAWEVVWYTPYFSTRNHFSLQCLAI